MNREEAIKLIDEVTKTSTNLISSSSLLSRNRELNEFLKPLYPNLTSPSEMRYWLIHNLNDYPVCPICGKKITKFSNGKYPRTCSQECGCKHPHKQESYLSTCLIKYNTTNTSKVKTIRDKIGKNRNNGSYKKIEVKSTDDIIKYYNELKSKNLSNRTIGGKLGNTKSISKILKNIFPHLTKNTEKIYWLINNLTKYPKCLRCGKPCTHFASFSQGYHKFCSIQCAVSDNTNVESNFTLQTAKESILQTIYESVNDYSASAKLRRNKELSSFLRKIYPNVETNIERCYWLVHDLKEKVTCPICGKFTNFKGFQEGYYTHCSKKCMECSPYIKKLGFKYYFNGIVFDSSFEILYYLWMIKHNIDFNVHPSISFEYIDPTNKQVHNYHPDFYRNDIQQYVEIKGEQFFDENGNMINPFNRDEDPLCKSKQNCIYRNNVLLLRESDLKNMGIDVSKCDTRYLRRLCNYLHEENISDFCEDISCICKSNYQTFFNIAKEMKK